MSNAKARDQYFQNWTFTGTPNMVIEVQVSRFEGGIEWLLGNQMAFWKVQQYISGRWVTTNKWISAAGNKFNRSHQGFEWLMVFSAV